MMSEKKGYENEDKKKIEEKRKGKRCQERKMEIRRISNVRRMGREVRI